jgi:hypothetical protein
MCCGLLFCTTFCPAGEVIMTFTLISTVYACGIAKPGHGSMTPIAVGFSLIACAGAGAKYTGAALNPARVLGEPWQPAVGGCRRPAEPGVMHIQRVGCSWWDNPRQRHMPTRSASAAGSTCLDALSFLLLHPAGPLAVFKCGKELAW